MTILLVDDEPLAREGLRELLNPDPEVTAIYEARDGREAVHAIRGRRPDLVFLDVQMPEMDGFAVVAEIGPEQMPPVVFVTAFDKYAIQAFEINALDYLLKPVTEKRFLEAVNRAKSRALRPAEEGSQQIRLLLETIGAPRKYPRRLAVRSAGKTVFVEIEKIDWAEAAENYVQLHVGRATHLLHVTMNVLEDAFDPEMFLRIHRSLIVNVNRIKELQPVSHGEYMVTLHDGVRLQSSRSYQEKVKALAANPF
jgi:two-component system LytT family response regulator